MLYRMLGAWSKVDCLIKTNEILNRKKEKRILSLTEEKTSIILFFRVAHKEGHAVGVARA